MPRTYLELMESIDSGLKKLHGGGDLKGRHGGSRFVGEGADDDLIDRLSALEVDQLDALGVQVSEKRGRAVRQRGSLDGPGLADVLLVQADDQGATC